MTRFSAHAWEFERHWETAIEGGAVATMLHRPSGTYETAVVLGSGGPVGEPLETGDMLQAQRDHLRLLREPVPAPLEAAA